MQCTRIASNHLINNDNKTKFMYKISKNMITDTVKISVKIFVRDTSPYYYCKVKKPDTGKWVQKSTQTKDRDEALIVAQDWFSEMRILHKRGYASTSTKFSHASDLYIATLYKELALSERTDRAEGRSVKDIKSYRNTVTQYIKPHLGNKPIDQVSNVDVQPFFDWRRTYWTEGPGTDTEFHEYERGGNIVKRPVDLVEATDGTITRAGLVLTGLYKTVVKHGLIEPVKVPV